MLRLVSSNTGWMLIRVTDTMSSGTNSAATPFMSITVVANTTVRYENLLSLAVHTTVEKSLLKRWCKSKSYGGVEPALTVFRGTAPGDNSPLRAGVMTGCESEAASADSVSHTLFPFRTRSGRYDSSMAAKPTSRSLI